MGLHVSDEAVLECLRAVRDTDSHAEAARKLGIPRETLTHRVKNIAPKRGLSLGADLPPREHPQYTPFPDDDVSAEVLLDHHEASFRKRWAYEQSRRWFRITMPTDEPIALGCVGDPHLGSMGCNIPLLRRDVGILAGTDGMYAINIGDTCDNWSGKLLALYAHNATTKAQERRLARWFLQDAGIDWLVWLLGNHDTMDGGFAAYLKTIGGHEVPMMDWDAKFIIEFPNGREVKFHCAHGFKGNSQWNKAHGAMKAQSFYGTGADVYLEGHKHQWYTYSSEDPERGQVVHFAMARGYKMIDSYAVRHQFPNHLHGATVTVLIDPQADDDSDMVALDRDLPRAARTLTDWRKHRRGK